MSKKNRFLDVNYPGDSLLTNSSFSNFFLITRLPEKIMLQIFSHLTHPELCNIARVCKMWRRLAYDQSLWQSLNLRPEYGGIFVSSCLYYIYINYQVLVCRDLIDYRFYHEITGKLKSTGQPLHPSFRSFSGTHHRGSNRVPEVLVQSRILATFQFMNNPYPGINGNKTRRSGKSLFLANSFSYLYNRKYICVILYVYVH
ncbi:unnamed protein product [Trichobilharzia regenti]|nr:unnamed protein product [Trichobilharzia regenti]